MNKSKFFLAVLIYSMYAFTFQHAIAQIKIDKCGTDEYLKQQLKSDPTLQSKLLLNEKYIQKWIQENYHPDSNSVITIPIVVHVVYNTDEQNISDQRIFDQIAIINRDYSGHNYHSMGLFSNVLKANTGIQFCLAHKAPDGKLTTGIERKKTNIASFIMNDSVKFYNNGGLNAWDPTKYFNIWVCNLVVTDSSGYIYSGYGQYPEMGINSTFGVVLRCGAFGPTDSTYFRGNGGCLTHEIGHCFGLRHIWGDDDLACIGSDNCDDTPNQAGRTTGIHTGLLTDACSPSSPGIMYMNFMDYSDDIVYANFTPDQTARMLANFAAPYGYLVSLANSDACSEGTYYKEQTTPVSANLSIFPNPASDFIEISDVFVGAHSNVPLQNKVNIYNILGECVLSVPRNPNPESQKIDISALAFGVYYLKVGDRVCRFVKW